MINKIDKERRHSMNAAPIRPSNKRQRQGAQEDSKEKIRRFLEIKLPAILRHNEPLKGLY
jgi:hypothetical protein